MSPHTRAMLLLLATMVVWGSTFVVTKGLIAEVPPYTLAFARVATGSAVLLAAVAFRASSAVCAMAALPWRAIVPMGVIGVALYYMAFNVSMLHISASQGALVQSCIPGVTALVAAVWLRERPSAVRWAGIVLSIAGVLIIFSGARVEHTASAPLGNLLMFATTVCWAAYTALAKRVAALDPLAVAAGVTAVGALLLLPAAAFELAQHRLPVLSIGSWLAIGYLGAIASGFAYLFYNAALKHLSAAEAGVYTNLIPVVGVVSGLVLLGEPLSARAVIGGLVVLAGVWLTSWRKAAGRRL